jgi:hypothetical protein
MKTVHISERDRAILKGCCVASVQGKTSIDDMQALYDANQKIKTNSAPVDIETTSEVPNEYNLEDAQLAALKRVFAEGRPNLRNSDPVVKGCLDLHAHLEAAKDKPAEETPAK